MARIEPSATVKKAVVKTSTKGAKIGKAVTVTKAAPKVAAVPVKATAGAKKETAVKKQIAAAQPVTITVKPGDTNAKIAESLGVNPEVAKQYIPVAPRVGTELTVPVTEAPMPVSNPALLATSGYGTPDHAQETRLATTGYGQIDRLPPTTAPVVVQEGQKVGKAVSEGRIVRPVGTPAAGYGQYVPSPGAPKPYSATAGVMTPTEARAGMGYGPSTAIFTGAGTEEDAVKAAAWRVQTFLGQLGVRPEFITSDVQSMLGLTPVQMEAMGYASAPNGQWYRINFSDMVSEDDEGAGLGGGGGGGGYGAGGGYGGGGYAARAELINWRIGL